jgi:hypothetical protein
MCYRVFKTNSTGYFAKRLVRQSKVVIAEASSGDVVLLQLLLIVLE